MNSATEQLKELSRNWTEWTAIVRLFADKRVRGGDFNRERYQTVHSGLLQLIADSRDTDTIDAAALNRMNELSAPWINVDALSNADARLVRNLAEKCEEVRQQWFGAKTHTGTKFPAFLIVVLFLGVFALVLGTDNWSSTYHAWFDGSKGKVPHWLHTLEQNREFARNWVLGGTLTAATLLVTWFVFRPPKTY